MHDGQVVCVFVYTSVCLCVCVSMCVCVCVCEDTQGLDLEGGDTISTRQVEEGHVCNTYVLLDSTQTFCFCHAAKPVCQHAHTRTHTD